MNDGSMFALLTPFAGDRGLRQAAVESGKSVEAMCEYYRAVAAVAVNACGIVCHGGRDAAVSGGLQCGRLEYDVRSTGVVVRKVDTGCIEGTNDGDICDGGSFGTECTRAESFDRRDSERTDVAVYEKHLERSCNESVGGRRSTVVSVSEPVKLGGVLGSSESCNLKRGKNYQKNREKKRRRNALRAQKSEAEKEVSQGEAVNRAWRSTRVENQKRNLFERSQRVQAQGHFFDLPEDSQKALKGSYAARLLAENELKEFRARQQLDLEKAKDFAQLKKRQETQIMRQTELNKVQVEKAFAQLARSGNVPGVVGTVETVVSSGSSSSSHGSDSIRSGTISPNSSVSAAEVRALQQSELDKTHENEKLRARLEKLKLVAPQMYSDLGFDRELPPTVGTGVTLGVDGNPVLPEIPDDCSDVFAYDGYVGEDGRFHFGENPAIYDA